jgi:hypothetical protein
MAFVCKLRKAARSLKQFITDKAHFSSSSASYKRWQLVVGFMVAVVFSPAVRFITPAMGLIYIQYRVDRDNCFRIDLAASQLRI